ncbi:DUF4167 domain-containing protein [Mesorhizobium marinum]|uniref:DUF4167 domain-containing protein n=1 Tax=Mesorhizobium marinum TaxID=3228790 RepID=UPI003F5C72C8
MRGRNGGGGNNNQNRKGPNPLTRNYESNGPDVKIRGSAQQIAEKYAQLARDAQSSGDRVMAENYLQHAEHYNRIIAAAQAQMPIQNVQNQRDASDDDGDDERDEFDNVVTGQNQGNAAQPAPSGNRQEAAAPGNEAEVDQASGPQPVIEGVPAEVALNPEAAGEGNGARERAVNGHGEGRRSRRPRRGERSRPDTEGGDADEASAEQGLAATLSRGAAPSAPQEPAAEAKGEGDPELADTGS